MSLSEYWYCKFILPAGEKIQNTQHIRDVALLVLKYLERYSIAPWNKDKQSFTVNIMPIWVYNIINQKIEFDSCEWSYPQMFYFY